MATRKSARANDAPAKVAPAQAAYLIVFRPSGGTFTDPQGSSFSVHASGALLIISSAVTTTHAFAPGQWATVNVP